MELKNLVQEDPKKGIFRVHRSALTSPDILELERKNIFDRSWLYLGHESEVANPGDFKRRTVAGRP
ncbi:MAG: Rieske (2Fe-2S) domain-containing protein, partial [Deltaproteobacteria bacterium]|nr:Rieske (2Fe-2S) domain-containing protein [Deltaproteobacteria bacterium]